MNLTGSRTESEFREQLVASRKGLFEDSANPALFNILSKLYPEMYTAYVIDWVPDQGEDSYVVFVNGTELVAIELDKFEQSKPIVEKIKIENYKKGLKRINQIKFLVAEELARNEIITRQ